MRIRLAAIAAAILLVSISAFAQDLRVIETGTFHDEEVEAKNGEIWLGLFKRGDSYMLMPSILSVENVYDAIIDSEGDASGVSVTVPGMGQPAFLIRGRDFEQARPVTTLPVSGKEIGGGFDESFEMNGRKYNLRLDSSEKTEGDFVGNDAKLILTDGTISHTLYEVEECSFCKWSVDWAGDLDSDGKPDFYLYVTYHYNVANQKLFLSSKAESGRLVKEVAEFVTTGC